MVGLICILDYHHLLRRPLAWWLIDGGGHLSLSWMTSFSVNPFTCYFNLNSISFEFWKAGWYIFHGMILLDHDGFGPMHFTKSHHGYTPLAWFFELIMGPYLGPAWTFATAPYQRPWTPLCFVFIFCFLMYLKKIHVNYYHLDHIFVIKNDEYSCL